MLAENARRILELVQHSWTVVDVGGWAQPFTRANYVVDLMPYETRGIFGRVGPGEECFSRDRWLTVDVCSEPLPFPDQSIDYLVCSHTLEDLRDPIHVCREINRVARHGYIEVPSRRMETIWSLEHPGYPGYYHHRWLVEIADGEIVFRFKTPLMCQSWRYVLPRTYLHRLPLRDRVAALFWDGAFDYREIVQLSEENVAEELEAFVRRLHVYPAWRYAADHLRPDVRRRAKRLLKTTPHLRPLANYLLGRELAVADEEQFWSAIPDHESR